MCNSQLAELKDRPSSINFAASSQLALSRLAPSVVKHYTGSKTAQDPFEYGSKALINNNTAPVQKPRRTPFSEFFVDLESHSHSCHIEAKRRKWPSLEFVHHLHRKMVRNIREYRNSLGLGLQPRLLLCACSGSQSPVAHRKHRQS